MNDDKGHKSESEKREAREAALRRQWNKRRGFKHAAQYTARRTVSEATESADYSAGYPKFSKAVELTRSVSGLTIIVRPDTSSRDKRKALMHWARQNGVVLIPVEAAASVASGYRTVTVPVQNSVRVCNITRTATATADTETRKAPIVETNVRPETLVTAYQAFGSGEALYQLTLHKYVRHEKGEEPRWTFATTFRGTYGQTELARKPVAKIPYKPHGEYVGRTGPTLEELLAERADATLESVCSTERVELVDGKPVVTGIPGDWVTTMVVNEDTLTKLMPVWEAAYRHAEARHATAELGDDGKPVPYETPELADLMELM